MKRKTALYALTVLLTLGLMFTACEQPTKPASLPSGTDSGSSNGGDGSSSGGNYGSSTPTASDIVNGGTPYNVSIDGKNYVFTFASSGNGNIKESVSSNTRTIITVEIGTGTTSFKWTLSGNIVTIRIDGNVPFTLTYKKSGNTKTLSNPKTLQQGMTLAEATAAIKAIPVSFDASKDEPLQIVFAGDMTYTEAEGTAFYNAMKAAPDASVAIDMAQADITEIPDGMFNRCKSLASVILPRSVTRIGKNSFYECDALFSVIIPQGVTKIEEYAFAFCHSLERVTIPDSVTSIGNMAFSTTKLKNVTIPNGVTTIDTYAFAYCTSLESITIPRSVTSIGMPAFGRCPLLKINVDSGNTKYSSENGVLYNKTKTEIISWPSASGDLIIPSGVSIANYAFWGCLGLKSVTIPSNVTSIGNLNHSSVFYGCENLISVNIPASVTSIGGNAFQYCTSLATINYAGTKDDWNTKITFGGEWKNNIPTTTGVTCSDGTYKFVGNSSSTADSKLGDPI